MSLTELKNLLVKRLSRLKAGEKSWFWFSHASPNLPLMLEPFANPKGMASLMSQAGNMKLPRGSRFCTGIATISDSGEFLFASPMFDDGMLNTLAEWVKRNVKKRPEVAKLSGCQFLRIVSSGVVEQRFKDDSLWEGIKRPSIPGTLQGATDLISRLDTGKEAWLWMSEENDRSEPLAAGCLIENDPTGKQFAKLVLAGRARSSERNAGLRGVLRRLTTGGLLITTEDDLSAVGEQLKGWLESFGNLRLVQMKGEEALAVLRVGGLAADEDFSGVEKALKEIKKGKEYMFWFSRMTRNGRPLLIIEQTRPALKSAALEVTVGAPAIRGHISHAKWGFEFKARKPFDQLLEELAAWISANHKKYPILLKLIDSRVTVRDKAGTVTHRFKDNNVWNPLRTIKG